MRMYYFFCTLVTLFLSLNIYAADYPWLSEFGSTDDVFESGEKLMSLEYGLHALEEESLVNSQLIIAVHGGQSRGYEWVYPLKILDSNIFNINFFRWNDLACPEPSAIRLNELISKKLMINPKIERVILISHSYGGLLTSWFYENWVNAIPMEIHAIATPIAGIELVNNICNYSPPKRVLEGVYVNQWLTQKELDGEFKDLEFDPQIIDLEKNETFLLPSKYRDKRLGHNWSISYVADELIKIRIKKKR